MKRHWKFGAAAVLSAVVLAACGGGGDDGGGPAATTPPPGGDTASGGTASGDLIAVVRAMMQSTSDTAEPVDISMVTADSNDSADPNPLN